MRFYMYYILKLLPCKLGIVLETLQKVLYNPIVKQNGGGKMTERYKYSREGYLNENFRMFHLRDAAVQYLYFHFHEFDKIVVLIS